MSSKLFSPEKRGNIYGSTIHADDHLTRVVACLFPGLILTILMFTYLLKEWLQKNGGCDFDFDFFRNIYFSFFCPKLVCIIGLFFREDLVLLTG